MSEKKIIAVFGATGAQGGGLARAIAADAQGAFAARAITRKPDSDAAKALTALGIEVVAADADQPDTLAAALEGAYGAFCVTNFWEHFSAEREGAQATAMARAMITQWGMSDKLGPIRYGEREEMMFLNRQFSEHRNYSDKVAQEIDEEVRRLVDEAHDRCFQLLTAHWEKMEVLTAALLEVETINAQEFQALMRGENPFPPSTKKPPQMQQPREVKGEDAAREQKRGDLDLGGTLPAPA